jgi:hypothetical protein
LRESPRNYRLASFSVCLAFVLLSPCASAQVSNGTERATQNGALQTTIKADGTYELDFSAVDWQLVGRLPVAPESVQSTPGKDAIGPYDAVSATYLGGARTAEIRIYQALPIAIFRDLWNSAGANDHPFPAFDKLPAGLMKFSYQRKTFGTYEFGALGPEGPWSLFDKQGNVMMLSPADNFLVSRMNESPEGAAESRLAEAIQTLPAGFSHSTLLVFDKGMNQAFSVWGSVLLALGGKQRPANDATVVLAKLGYWTDNGARYYYKFDSQLGYTGTLLAIRDQFRKLGVPLGYMQLDSWWYPKGVNARWNSAGSALLDGEHTYRADMELFPDGLAAFQQALGLPIATHARWISTASPYRAQYKMSGNVVLDPAFWKSTSDYLAAAGVVTYEQDWLDHNAATELNLNDPQSFLENMSEATRSKGITIQYCMPLPSHYMASTQYSNVQTIRTSDDRFNREKWDSFLYDARLATAVSLWPWTDAFFSNELPNLILSTLSAGPVGVGDALGETNAHNLSAAVRADGLIVKPDSPLLPINSMYASDALNRSAPMVAMSQSKFGEHGAYYVFAYARSESQEGVTVPLRDLEMSGPVFAYDWVTHSGELIPDGGSLQMKFADGWDYQVLSTVNREGLALLGDTEKIVPSGKQRIAAVEEHGSLTMTIKFAHGEDALTISGYASRRPRLKVRQGKLNSTAYDPQTKIFRAQVAPARSGEAILQASAR